MEKPERIKLDNRDGANMWLEYNKTEDFYTFKCKEPFYYKYWTMSTDPNTKEIVSADPPGGPFLYVGYVFPEHNNLKLVKIEDCDAIVKFILDYD